MKTLATTSSRRAMLIALGALTVGGLALRMRANAAEEARVIPPFEPGAPEAPSQGSEESIVLAGGCFWGVQGVFQHVKGVTSAVSGYAGGEKSTAQYEQVGSGTTGHAESVRVVFDPRQISYARILQIFFSVAHDPTQLNRQGPDSGPQYRSAIFPTTTEQAATAKAYIAQLNQARAFGAAIVTKIEKDKVFYPAELYHQDFLTRHPTHPYIVYNDLPKIDDLKRIFANEFRAEPVLVNGAKSAS